MHGLEHIGAQVVLAGLRSIVTRLQWDATLHHLLGQLHLVFMPVVNPGGMARGTRANPQVWAPARTCLELAGLKMLSA